MIDSSPQKFIKQGNNYYQKVKNKLSKYSNDLLYMNKQLNKSINCSFLGNCLTECSRLSRQFQRAFKTLSKLQQAQLYSNYAHITYNCLFNVPESAFEIPQNQINFKVFILSNSSWRWQPKQIKIDFQEKHLSLVQEQISINLINYIMRLSRNKERKGIVLQSTSSNEYIESLRISNYEGSFQQFLTYFTQIMNYCLKERICRRLGKTIITQENFVEDKIFIEDRLHHISTTDKFMDYTMNQQSQRKLQKTAVFNQSMNEPVIRINKPLDENMKSFEAIKHYLDDNNHAQNYTPIRQNVYYDYRNQIMKKAYVFEITKDQQLYLTWICDNFNNHNFFANYKTYLISVKLLQFQQNNKIYHQVYEIDNKIRAQLTFKRSRYITSNFIYFFDRNVSNNPEYHAYKLDFGIVKIEKSINYITVTQQCRIQLANNNIKDVRLQLCDKFLGDISSVIKGFSLTTNESNEVVVNSYLFQQGQLSKIQQLGVSNIDDFCSINEAQNNSRQITEKSPQYYQISRDYFDKQKSDYSGSCLTVRHPIQPHAKQAPAYRYSKTPGMHPLWQDQFEVNSQGQIVAINLQKVSMQGGILRQIFKQVAKKIISGKNILNISLPAKVLGPSTMLSNLCESYAYAPSLLQIAANKQDPIQKIKYVALFDISCIIAQMSNLITFNPILGQTYQGMIDGCPIYAQQISHRPPISAIFMKGRGYTIYGQFQIKSILGFNSVVLNKEGLTNIDFDDGTHIKIKSYKVQLAGAVYGDRKLDLIDSSHYIDIYNRIYLKLRFGKHHGITQYARNNNVIEGKIVKISQKADIKHFWNIGNEDVIEQYRFIKGRWTDEIYYQEQCIFNSWKDLPFILTPYAYSLQSDSMKRLDIKQKIVFNDQKAQQFKQDLENIQRKDRKLRQKYKK